MNVSKAEYECLKLMTDDLMEAEYFINNLGVETRTDEVGDEFRNIVDILKDIVTVCNNNPTILDDCVEFLATDPQFDYEADEFQSKYNLEGIYKIEEDK